MPAGESFGAPLPRRLRDAAHVYEDVTSSSGSPPMLIGDSAGGNIATALCVAAIESGQPAICPRADVAMAESHLSGRDVPLESSHRRSVRASGGEEAVAMYLPGGDPRHTLASPGLAELERWPDTLLFASTDEVLLDDSAQFVYKLASTARVVHAVFRAGVPHAWPAVLPDDPAGVDAYEFDPHLRRPAGPWASEIRMIDGVRQVIGAPWTEAPSCSLSSCASGWRRSVSTTLCSIPPWG